jgi:hypothetical protein
MATEFFPQAARCCVLFAALQGCDRTPDVPAPLAVPAPSRIAASRRPPAPVVSAAQTAGIKLQGYIGCYNQIDASAHRSIARYASWVKNMKDGPTGKELVVHGLYALDSQNIAKCADTFPQTANLKPSMATLDTAAEMYIKALSGMDKAVQVAYVYYDRQNHKDDKFAQGRALHAPLAASFETFMESSLSFSAALDVENDLVLTAKLSELEKTEGRKLPYFKMALMSRAKLLSHTASEEKFEATKAGEQMLAFEAIVDEGLTYASSHPSEQPANWENFALATQTFSRAAKERVRRMRDKIAYNASEQELLEQNGAGAMVQGSSDKLTEAYNGMIAAGNGL